MGMRQQFRLACGGAASACFIVRPPWARGGANRARRAAASFLFVFVLAATCTMLQQVLTSDLPPTQNPCTPQHFTPTCLPTNPLHLIAISGLVMNSLSGAYRLSSPQCSLMTDRPWTSTQNTQLTPANTQPQHPMTKYTQEPCLYPPPPLAKEQSSVGPAQHRTGWRLISVPPLRFTLQTFTNLGCMV